MPCINSGRLADAVAECIVRLFRKIDATRKGADEYRTPEPTIKKWAPDRKRNVWQVERRRDEFFFWRRLSWFTRANLELSTTQRAPLVFCLGWFINFWLTFFFVQTQRTMPNPMQWRPSWRISTMNAIRRLVLSLKLFLLGNMDFSFNRESSLWKSVTPKRRKSMASMRCRVWSILKTASRRFTKVSC